MTALSASATFVRPRRQPTRAVALLLAAVALSIASPASAAPPRPGPKKPSSAAPKADKAVAPSPTVVAPSPTVDEESGADKGAGKAEGSDDERKNAQRAFAEGQHAFKNRDFKHAAESFEAAYKSAPHPDALWNAARSWSRAGERTRAANLYAQYLEEAPPKARDRDSANDALRELASQLARLEVHASDVTDVKLDGTPLTRTTIYVTPGTHVLEGVHAGRSFTKSQDVTAGTIVSVALIPPEAPRSTAPLASGEGRASGTGALAPKAKEGSHGMSPAVFIVGAALTVGAGGALVWSGLDTVNARKLYPASPTKENFDAGKFKQLRTNVLIGVTSGLGALTLLSAVFTDWHGGASAKGSTVGLGVGAGSITVHGTF